MNPTLRVLANAAGVATFPVGIAAVAAGVLTGIGGLDYLADKYLDHNSFEYASAYVASSIGLGGLAAFTPFFLNGKRPKETKAENSYQGDKKEQKTILLKLKENLTLENAVKAAILAPGVAATAAGCSLTISFFGRALFGAITHVPTYYMSLAFGEWMVAMPLYMVGITYTFASDVYIVRKFDKAVKNEKAAMEQKQVPLERKLDDKKYDA